MSTIGTATRTDNMAITVDANSLEARYGKAAPAEPTKEAEFYYPGSGKPPPAQQQGQIPKGQEVPPGVIIQQLVGRGQPAPSMAVVPPKEEGGVPAPSMAVVPPQPTNRTTIGTFVEQSPPISRTTSNPMVATQPEVPTGTAEPPVQPPKPEKKKKVDLAQLLLDHIFELGGEDSEAAQKFYDRSPATMKNWLKNPAAIPLQAINKFLQKRPGVVEMIADELEPHFAVHDRNGIQSLPNRGKTNVVVCSPILGQPTLPFMWALVYLAKKYELGFDIQSDTVIHRSRNMLAQRFLNSGALWSLWLDSDIVPPIANAEWYRWITGSTTIPDEACRYDVLARLTGHNKAVIGGVYASRRWHGQLVIQPEIRPRSHEDKLLCNDLRKGTARGLVEVDWIGFGCALVHREVFLEVQRRFPELAPQVEYGPWRFFQPIGDEGEDEAFCTRIKACSIPIWLDTQLVCGHVGNVAFMPEHTAPVAAF
jgi:hypothetical protein